MSRLKGMTIGFIGLGLMGRPMSGHLLSAGGDLVIHNRSQEVVRDLVAEGMTAADTPRAVGEACDTIILMLTNTAAVEAVLSGDDGLLAGLRPGALVIDMGTTAVTESRRFAELVEEAGGSWVDAPVSGGRIGAQGATLSIMAGGSEEDFARAAPLFEILGQRLTHVGAVGAGQVAKSANQVIVGLTIGAVSEAMFLARRAGVDPARVREAIQGGHADSRILKEHGQRIVERKFTPPGGRVTIQQKDMTEALKLAAEVGIDLPAVRLNRELYDKVIEAGFGDLDHAGLYKYYDPEEPEEG